MQITNRNIVYVNILIYLKAQRCTRLSDQYARYGLYNEALKKLEESIGICFRK